MTTDEQFREQTIDEQFQDFSEYLSSSYRAGILRLDQMLAEANDSLDEIMGSSTHAAALEEGRAEGMRQRHDAEPPAVACADPRLHGDHLWTHPEAPDIDLHCLGVHDALTIPIAATKADLERVPGFPSARIFVLDEDRTYEYVSDEIRWKVVGG